MQCLPDSAAFGLMMPFLSQQRHGSEGREEGWLRWSAITMGLYAYSFGFGLKSRQMLGRGSIVPSAFDGKRSRTAVCADSLRYNRYLVISRRPPSITKVITAGIATRRIHLAQLTVGRNRTIETSKQAQTGSDRKGKLPAIEQDLYSPSMGGTFMRRITSSDIALSSSSPNTRFSSRSANWKFNLSLKSTRVRGKREMLHGLDPWNPWH